MANRNLYFVMIVVLMIGSLTYAEGQIVRLLTIGNSFADNALTYLPEIVTSSGHKLVYTKANLGGSTMKRHWEHVEKYEADPADKAGSPYGGGRFSLAQLLQKEHWDVVTIQQVSWQSHDLSTYLPYAQNLYAYVHHHAPQAKILLHQTWAYRVDDDRFKPSNQGKEPHTQAVMYQEVRHAYHTVARHLGVGLLPSGDAMYLADMDPVWRYRPDTVFDFQKAQKPQLPDQTHSLHAGYRWQKQTDGSYTLGMDGHHANQAGEYLLGCVWYEVLYKQPLGNHVFVPTGFDPSYADFLRRTAHRAVEELHSERPSLDLVSD